MLKTLDNTSVEQAKGQVADLKIWGDPNTFRLISKASSESEGWMKSTKALKIPGGGCVIQVTTQQRNPDGSYALAEAVTFVPRCLINETLGDNGEVISRALQTY